MAAIEFEAEPVFSHVSVMLGEVLAALEPTRGGVFVDATAGGAGHSAALLAASPNLSMIASDREPLSVRTAQARLAQYGERARVVHASFDQIPERLAEAGITQIDGLLADLGLSSQQLADAERGMSFRATSGPLDMRMDPSRGETALELIERLSQDELANVIYELGEERRSRRVARCIKQALEAGELSDTLELRRAGGARGRPAPLGRRRSGNEDLSSAAHRGQLRARSTERVARLRQGDPRARAASPPSSAFIRWRIAWSSGRSWIARPGSA